MDVTTVEQAVTMLQQQGKPVSVRNVHRLTGGSFRDISRILRALQPCLLAGSHVSTDAPQAPQEPAQPVLSREAMQALAAYHNAVDAYEEMRQRDWKRMPMAPYVVLTPLWRQVEVAKQQCLVLGIDPERDGR